VWNGVLDESNNIIFCAVLCLIIFLKKGVVCSLKIRDGRLGVIYLQGVSDIRGDLSATHGPLLRKQRLQSRPSVSFACFACCAAKPNRSTQNQYFASYFASFTFTVGISILDMGASGHPPGRIVVCMVSCNLLQ